MPQTWASRSQKSCWGGGVRDYLGAWDLTFGAGLARVALLLNQEIVESDRAMLQGSATVFSGSDGGE